MREATERRCAVPGLLGAAMARVYGAAIGSRNRRFDSGRGVITFDRPVISVGNLSVGGTGKTPMVVKVVRELREAGHVPCIAMRGYRADQTGGESDERGVYAMELSETPVVAQANRVEGLIRLFATEEGEHVDCVVLDDGFQHRRIARQFDIVLIDATRDVFVDRLLPAGWLREPVSSLSRAHAVVVTHAESASGGEVKRMMVRVREIAPEASVAAARHAWSGLRAEGGDRVVAWLGGKRIIVVCAIGNPGPFLAACERHASRVVKRFVLPDHDPLDRRLVSEVIGSAAREHVDAIVCTEKDWTKLRRVEGWRWPCDVVRPRLVMEFVEGWGGVRERMLEVVGRGVDE